MKRSIINLMPVTAGVCMKVRFKSKATRGFSFLPLCDSYSPFHESKKNQETPLGPGYVSAIKWTIPSFYLRPLPHPKLQIIINSEGETCQCFDLPFLWGEGA